MRRLSLSCRLLNLTLLVGLTLFARTACAADCRLYPIALSLESTAHVAPGAVIADAFNGSGPGQFGWLSWDGSPSVPTLVHSLLPPGDSERYVHPDDPSDHQIDVGDWISGKPGLSNAKPIRAALDALKGQDLVVPVWDQARGRGEKAAYRVCGFARIQLLGYHLPGRNRIGARFLGWADCHPVNQPPRVNVGADQTLDRPGTIALAADVSDDGLPDGQMSLQWSLVAGPAPLEFSDPSAARTDARFSLPGVYCIRFTANDGQWSAAADVTVTVSHFNQAPEAEALTASTLEDTPLAVPLEASDPDGDPVRWQIVTLPVHGQLVGDPPMLRYEPAADYNGSDQFTFTVTDGQLTSAPATVELDILPVNDPPVAVAQTVALAEDTALEIPLSGSDVEGSPLTYELVEPPRHGIVEFPAQASNSMEPSASHLVCYAPDPDFHGTDQFQFRVNDGQLDSPPVSVQVSVWPVNDAPEVSASPQRVVVAGQSTALEGKVTDVDNLPGELELVWVQMAGPAAAMILDPQLASTPVTFPVPGVYVLRLEANDGVAMSQTETIWRVRSPEQNTPPAVNAGVDLLLGGTHAALLAGQVSDDGLPAGLPLNVAWSVLEGPAPAWFESPEQARSAVRFAAAGSYRLQLEASDTEFTVCDQIQVQVHPGNLPPLVDAGPDQTVIVPNPCLLDPATHRPIDPQLRLSRSLSAVDHWNLAIGQPGLDGTVGNNCLAGSGTNIFVAGGFRTAGGIEAHASARWDGTTWHALFDPRPLPRPGPFGSNISYVVHECGGAEFCNELLDAVGARGAQAFVAGSLQDLAEVSDNYWDLTARWTGHSWESWGFKHYGNHVRTIVARPDRVYLGGHFAFQPTDASPDLFAELPWSYGVATWDGEHWGTLGSGIVDIQDVPLAANPACNWYSAYVTSLAVTPEGEVFAGGQFLMETPYGLACHIAHWDGVQWRPLGSGLVGNGLNFVVMALALDAQGHLYAGGNFSGASGVPARNIARWDGQAWHPVGSGVNGTVHALAAHGLAIYAGGAFSQADGWPVAGIARWDGMSWSPLGTRTDFGVRGAVGSLLVDDQGLYVAGNFTHAGGQPANHVALWEFATPPEETIQLEGRVSDDGQPAGAPLTTRWSQVNGPGTAEFADATLARTTVRFSAAGVYVLRLTADDSEFSSSDDITVVVRANQPPTVEAGPDAAIGVGEALQLAGTVQDDGLPSDAPVPFVWSALRGPSDVTFAHPASLDTTVRFAAEGVYTLRLKANDTQFTAQDDRVVTVLPVNRPPTIHAGPILYGQTVGTSARLAGQLTDDGRPGRPLRCCWHLVSGPGQALFADATAPDTTVLFTAPGQYWLRLAGHDGQLTAFADTIAYVYAGAQPPPQDANQAPILAANPRLSAVLHHPCPLEAAAADDQLPAGSTLSACWTVLSGPARVYFSDPGSWTSSAQFFAVGQYRLGLLVTDSQQTSTFEVSVDVVAPTNQPPQVGAGPDLEVTRPAPAALSGWVLDDGLPMGQSLTLAWQKVSGPGQVSFQPSPAQPIALASFSAPGVYVLQLRADDGQLSRQDEVTVIVHGGHNLPPTVDAGPDSMADRSLPCLLHPTVQDDGLPAGTLQSSWAQVDGPTLATFSSVNHQWRAHFPQPGVYHLELTVSDGEHTASDTVAITAVETARDPIVQLCTPARDQVITTPTQVIGTVDVPLLNQWRLEFRSLPPNLDNASDSSPATSDLEFRWKTLAEGTTGRIEARLATFDPTLLLNGQYELRLSATDLLGRSAGDHLEVCVDGHFKPGTFSIAFDDLTVPVASWPIRIRRSYDTRAALAGRQGDFGTGWALDLGNVRLQKNLPLGAAWEQLGSSGWYALRPTQPHSITIRFPDDQLHRFVPVAEPTLQFGYPIQWASLQFTNLPGTYGRLEIDGDTGAAPDGYSGPVELLDFDSFELFNPTRFRLITPDGFVCHLDEQRGLTGLTDPLGDTLTITTNGLIHSRGLSVRFERDPAGRIVRISDPQGHTLQYEYDDLGNLSASVDRDGRRTTYDYDTDHRLLALTDPQGTRLLRQTYDQQGRLVQQTDALGQAVVWQRDLTTRTEIIVNRLGHPTTTQFDPRGNVTRQVDPLGVPTEFTYDAADRLTAVRRVSGTEERELTFEHDQAGRLISFTDPLGHTTRLTYHPLGGLSSLTTPLGHTWTNQYNAQGLLLSATDPRGATTTYGYQQGLLTSVTNALGNVTRFAYNPFGRLTHHTDPLGHVTTYTRDANGLVTTQATTLTTTAGTQTLLTRHTYDASGRPTGCVRPDGADYQIQYDATGRPVALVDPLGRISRVARDSLGRAIELEHPDGSRESWTWDPEGRCTAHTNQLGHALRFTRDALGRVTSVQYPDGTTASYAVDAFGQLRSQTDPRGHTTWFDYDAAGQWIATTNALGAVTRATHDPDGNLESCTDPLGFTTSFAYDPAHRLVARFFADGTHEHIQYDPLGQLIAATDTAHSTTWYGHDPIGRLAAITNALGGLTRYTYNEGGALTTITDANQHTTRFDYDLVGRLLARTLPAGQTEHFQWDLAGRLQQRTDFNGFTTRFAYDLADRLLERLPDPRADESPTRFEYDAAGRHIARHDASGTTTNRYDSLHRLRERSILFADCNQLFTLAYDYDPNGNPTRIRSSATGGFQADYGYDALNRLTTIDAPGFGHTEYRYDAADNLTAWILPNGVGQIVEYDPRHRPYRIQCLGPAGPIAHFQYELDPAGRRIAAAESLVLNGEPNPLLRHFDYDPLGRLTAEQITAPAFPDPLVIRHAYDPVGNRLSQSFSLAGSSSRLDAAYDPNDRPLAFPSDDNGNLLGGLSADGSPFHDQYDTANRLRRRTTTHNGQPATLDLLYNGAGQRVAHTLTRNANTSRTLRILDDRNPTGFPQTLEEWSLDPDNQPRLHRRFLPGLGIAAQQRMTPAGPTVEFPGVDALGSVRFLTDSTGLLCEFYDYDAFGNLLQGAVAAPDAPGWIPFTPTPLRHPLPQPSPGSIRPAPSAAHQFAGQLWEPLLEAYHLRARDYDPALARFRSMDPFGGHLHDPASLHRYLYAHNNPVNRTDPSGCYDLATTSLGIALGRTLHDLYNNSVLSAGFGLMNTAEGIAQGHSDTQILAEYEVGALLGVAVGHILGRLLPIAGRALSSELSLPSPRQLTGQLRSCLDGNILRAREIVSQLTARPAGKLAGTSAHEYANWGGEFVDVGTAGTTGRPAYGVSFFDLKVVDALWHSPSLGRWGQPHFFMPVEDAMSIRTAADAARYSGNAPSVVRAYLAGESAYGLAFPTRALPVRVPTAADSGGWMHYLEGGRTAVRTADGSAYLLNPTREFVIPGGGPVPTGAVLFELGPRGEWRVLRRW